jgi:phage terminase small subunit
MQMKAFCAEFGLSPVSRARLSVERNAGDADADLMAILAQPRIQKKTAHEEIIQ